MVQQLLSFLPADLGKIAIVAAICAALAGLLLWLSGARYSRSLITLMAVSLGAVAGLQAPHYLGGSLAPWATAVIGALIVGISGYVWHRAWVGVLLGVVLVAWTALATWIVCRGDASWAWPVVEEGMTAAQYGWQLWDSLPQNVRHLLPFSCAAAMLGGLAVGMVWPKAGMLLLHSMLGMTVMICAGLSAVQSARPQWLDKIPPKQSTQLLWLALMLGVSVLVQWRLAPSAKAPALPKKQE